MSTQSSQQGTREHVAAGHPVAERSAGQHAAGQHHAGEHPAGATASVTDRGIIDYMRRKRLRHEGFCTVSDLVDFAGVTATAIRQRLKRLMVQGLVAREAESAGRGRPTHRYSLTPAGVQCGGSNYEDLAGVLWSEIRSVENREVRQGLLKRIVARLAEVYRDQVSGTNLQERMESLVGVMAQRDVPFAVTAAADDQLPVLTALACPYPDLAEQDRSICALEKMLFAEILGAGVRLSACRLDGENCCTFEASSRTSAAL